MYQMPRQIIDYPKNAKGAFCQGDIIIWRLPSDIKVDRSQKISERDGKIIISEGETIGHFHAIELMGGSAVHRFHDGAMAQSLEPSHAVFAVGAAALFIDGAVTQELARRDILVQTNQCIGYLVVEGRSVVLSHPEHDGARLPAGSYYVGFQTESAAGVMRRVQD
jgi:hypothetical protein